MLHCIWSSKTAQTSKSKQKENKNEPRTKDQRTL
jgi:hypothetical protein